MTDIHDTSTNRILVVDDDVMLIDEYLRCLGEDYEPDSATETLSELEKVLFGEETDERGAARFMVETRTQGEPAVEAVEEAVRMQQPYCIVFLDIRMPPGINGIEAAKQIRALDPDVNIVIVTGSMSSEAENLDKQVPPADKIFFFNKPFHAAECRQLAAALCGKWHADMALRRANEELEQRVEERTAALQKLAYYDLVTRLPNQLMLFNELQAMIDQSENTAGDSVVVLLDIDRFSFFNETMGFDGGTELLRSVGNRLSRNFCKEKMGLHPVIGRFGADEFVVLMPNVENDMAIRDFAEKVQQVVEEPFVIDGRDIFLKVSIGVAWHPVHGRDSKLIFRCAEAALHRSRRSLDGAITYYHSEMRYRAQHKFDMEAEFRSAIDNGQIKAFYQPQQSVETGKMAGIEALARWIRADGTVVPPCDFIPLSEQMGISDLVFETVLADVCNDIAKWREQSDWEVPVSVNLSAHQLRNADLVGLVKRVLMNKEVNRNLINLELTETALLEDLTTARPILGDLAEFGVGIHIDDFGTGYSSLSYLAELPVSTLKIDRSFVGKLADSESNTRVVQAIIALGKVMGLDIVAEGVETDQQYALVRRLGCDLVQGYFIAKPMPAEEFRRWCDGHEDTQSLKHAATVVGIDSARS
ncbi:MAG: EAL domain-containing protein [Gammaproteobacteria bacterium]|nr:EAL domain-containing protein [Gammaproteobacteria bacterium]MDH3750860.1 EAL domain-containing protein [Gammaproteobacteria bacterium]MDH3805950.1 EAL domain-containing protein [Gammaproteobacteria bacterium]